MDRSRKFALAAVGISLLAPLLVASAAAQGAPKPAVVLSGSVGSLPGSSALVVVQVGLPYGENNPRHIPAGFHYPAVAEQAITSSTFSIGVPDSATLQQAGNLGHGVVEFNVLVFSGTRFTSEMDPVALTQAAANGNRQALAQAQSRSVTMSRFRAFGPDPAAVRRAVSTVRRALSTVGLVMSPDGTIPHNGCGPLADGSPREVLTRIGEVHVGSTNGLSMRWDYNDTSDTTLSVGLSTSSDTGPWSLNGTYTTSNSLGSSGGFTAGNATRVYTDGDMWYQRYVWTGGAPLCGYFTNQVVSAVGDSVEGSNSPPANPYGGCAPGDDPLGYARLDPNNGYFDSDRATAEGYSVDATLWNFSFGGHTGFTNTIHHHYMYYNPGGGESYICGGDSGMWPNSKIIYSSGY